MRERGLRISGERTSHGGRGPGLDEAALRNSPNRPEAATRHEVAQALNHFAAWEFEGYDG
jgi:hypothetical protein